jgi:hypothetical protein
MDVAYISALSAIGGSIVGGLTSSITTWISQRSQARAVRLDHHRLRLEDLFRDFICAASEAYGDATESNQPKIQDLISLYGMTSIMRVQSTPNTVACAEKIINLIIECYHNPNKNVLDVISDKNNDIDPLREFAETARKELEVFGYA